VEEAERMSGCEIGSVFTGLPRHIKAQNSLGIVAVKGRRK
jgi:cell division ATPase FtsA